MNQSNASGNLRAFALLFVCAAAGVTVCLLYPDSYQQDGAYHYVFARWGWHRPELFLGVWARPLFTFLYSFPAMLGYRAAKLFSVSLCLITAWQTWRIAQETEFERPELVIPFLFLQPVLFLLCADTMTEVPFACIFALALRLHTKGYVKLGALAASLLVLTRPEGFFIDVMWGVWLLLDSRLAPTLFRRLLWTPIMATGAIIWILASKFIANDFLYVRNHWPQDWQATGAVYGRGPFWDYILHLPEFAGVLLMVPFVLGLFLLLWRRKHWTITSSFLTVFVLHSIFRQFGMFGSAGYARYFVTVAPAIALMTLVGWNQLASWCSGLVPRVALRAAAVAVLVFSGFFCLMYVDAMGWSRDAFAVNEMFAWWSHNTRPVTRLITSQAYQNIVFDRDRAETPDLGGDKEKNLATLKAMPSGTLIFWDGQTGPSWYKINADDIEGIGYKRLRSQSYVMDGYFIKRIWFGYGGPRFEEMHLLYKE